MSFSYTTTPPDSHIAHHSNPNSMHPQQYVTSIPGSPSPSPSSTTAVQVQAAAAAAAAAQAAANMPLITSIANVKDSRWLTLEVCREYQRGKCTRSEQECKFAHPPAHVEINSGKVIACFDSLKGKCNRTNPPCKYLHPPQHLRDILLQNGRNNLILRSIAMNIAANQAAIYPQTATHLPYPGSAIIQSPIQQAASIASYPHLGPAGPTQSTLLFNSAGQAFSIPLHPAHLSQISQASQATAVYSPESAQYFQPVTSVSSQTAVHKAPRADRLEVYSNNTSNHDALKQQTLANHEEDGNYSNGFVTSYQPYPNHIQTLYTRTPSVDLKESQIMTTSNGETLTQNVSSSSSSTSSSTGIKAVIDPVSSSSSITQQTKKRPLEDDTATTGAYLQLPPGTQLIAAPQYLQQQNQGQTGQPTGLVQQHQKRPAIADPKTGIPMAAYPLATFSYQSPSPIPMQFQQPYLTAVPMAFPGYTSHIPRL